MTKGKDLEGHFIWPFLAAGIPIYIYLYPAREKDPTENGVCKCERRSWLVSTNYLHNVFSPLVLLARTTLQQTDRQILPT